MQFVGDRYRVSSAAREIGPDFLNRAACGRGYVPRAMRLTAIGFVGSYRAFGIDAPYQADRSQPAATHGNGFIEDRLLVVGFTT